MNFEITIGLIALASLLGLGFKFFQGRSHTVVGHEKINLDKLQAISDGAPAVEFGGAASTILFSTTYCGICPGVNRQLISLTQSHTGLKHLEVDITDRLDLAAHFGINQTPTILITDSQGRIQSRISGPPRPGVIDRELEKLGVK